MLVSQMSPNFVKCIKVLSCKIYSYVHNDCVSMLYSAAKCLGARRVCQQAYQWLSKHNIISCVVEDQQAAAACLQFAGEYIVITKYLVMPLGNYKYLSMIVVNIIYVV